MIYMFLAALCIAGLVFFIVCAVKESDTTGLYKASEHFAKTFCKLTTFLIPLNCTNEISLWLIFVIITTEIILFFYETEFNRFT